jgi:hypothetical protein
VLLETPCESRDFESSKASFNNILYLARLHTDNLNPLLKEAFELSKSLDSQGVSNNT